MTATLFVLAPLFFAEGSQPPKSLAVAIGKPVSVPKRALVTEVRSILEAKCADCHGARLARPKGQFGNVEDLKRLAGDPGLVVPFRPDESKLWQLIRDNDMPPEAARAGPLSARQKQLIHDWIEAGATTGADCPASVAGRSPVNGAAPVATEVRSLPFFEHLLGWLGKLHVLVVHFPIALLIVAAFGELWWLCRGIHAPASATRFCALFAAAGAVAATILGWLHTAFGGYAASSSQALVWHRWTGTTAGAVAVAVAILSERDTRRGVRSPLFRVLLVVAALLVGIAGHLGGTLVYGASFFDW